MSPFFRRLLVALCAAAMFASGCDKAEKKTDQGAHPAAKAVDPNAPLVKPGEAKVGDKTTCPVSHEEFMVAADSPSLEHAGKTYYFCCKGCDEKFGKDPAKFLTH